MPVSSLPFVIFAFAAGPADFGVTVMASMVGRREARGEVVRWCGGSSRRRATWRTR